MAHHFPARRAEREGGLALRLGHGEQDLARDRDDERDHHDGEEHAGREQPDAVDRTREERDEAERVLDRGLHAPHRRHEDEDAHQSVDDTRHGDQELDQEGESVGDAQGEELGKTNCCAEPDRHCEREGEEGRHQRPVDEGEGAEAECHRVPGGRPKERPAECLPGQPRLEEQDGRHGARDGEHRERQAERAGAEDDIAQPARAHAGSRGAADAEGDPDRLRVLRDYDPPTAILLRACRSRVTTARGSGA